MNMSMSVTSNSTIFTSFSANKTNKKQIKELNPKEKIIQEQKVLAEHLTKSKQAVVHHLLEVRRIEQALSQRELVQQATKDHVRQKNILNNIHSLSKSSEQQRSIDSVFLDQIEQLIGNPEGPPVVHVLRNYYCKYDDLELENQLLFFFKAFEPR